MNNHTLVPKEIPASRRSAQIQIQITRLEACTGDIPMLAGQIPSLTGLRSYVLARVVFAAVSGVQVPEGGRAVSVGGNGHVVDVVDEGSVGCFGREAAEVYGEEDACAVGVCCACYGACYEGAGCVVKVCAREHGDVGCGWVIGLDGGVSAGA